MKFEEAKRSCLNKYHGFLILPSFFYNTFVNKCPFIIRNIREVYRNFTIKTKFKGLKLMSKIFVITSKQNMVISIIIIFVKQYYVKK